jgi:hypothetical protein
MKTRQIFVRYGSWRRKRKTGARRQNQPVRGCKREPTRVAENQANFDPTQKTLALEFSYCQVAAAV